MQIFTAQDAAPLAGLRPVVTLGVFDGVHRGHAKIISKVVSKAREMSVPGLAITFSSHPRPALGRASPPGICSLERRLALLSEQKLDAVWVLPFTPVLAATPALEFAEEFFHKRLSASAIVLGESAVFGRGREGNAALLSDWASEWCMPVEAVPPLMLDRAVVSSTAIRLAVQAGDLERAQNMLGRPVSVEGLVVRGQGKGRNFGFPTINIDPFHELRPPTGVWFTIAVIGGHPYNSVTNIGRPPTDAEIAGGLTDVIIETHLLDFDGDLYGSPAEIYFLRKNRDLMHFSDSFGLISRVEQDLLEARCWFADRRDYAGKP